MRPDERLFEEAITSWLVEHGGYRAVKFGNRPEFRTDFDASLGLDLTEMFAFIEETQPEEWAKVVKAHGGQKAPARVKFAKRLADQLDDHGTLDVLRHAVSDQGIAIRLFTAPDFRILREEATTPNHLITSTFEYPTGHR